MATKNLLLDRHSLPKTQAMCGCWDTVLIVLGLAAFLLIPMAYNHNFYFADDYQTFAMPVFLEIAHQLKAGVFPLVLDNVWHGGAIAAEGQYALFNPVCLLLYLCLDYFSDLAWAGAFFAIVHYAILAAGTHVLCLRLGFTRPAAVIGAMLACSSTWMLYWGAHSWILTIVSISWVPWCLTALHKVYYDRRWLPIGSIATALPLLSGYPFTTLSLMLLLGATLVLAAAAKAPMLRLARVGVSATLGAGLALPAIIPTAMYLHDSVRIIAGFDKFIWRVPLEGLLTAGLPTMFGPWDAWQGHTGFFVPSFFYLGWFVPIVLTNAGRSSLSSPLTRLILGLLGLFALLSISPAVGQFRYGMRYLPFVHFCAAVLVASVIAQEMSHPETPWRWRLWPTFAAIVIPCLIALAAAPQAIILHVFFAGLAALFAWGAARSLADKGGFEKWLIVGQATFLLLIIVGSPINQALSNWPVPTARAAGKEAGRELSLFMPVGILWMTPDFWEHLSVGNTGLLHGRQTVNGYSALQMPGLDAALCFNWISASCPEIVNNLFARDEKTGLPLLDLVRVSRVVAERGEYSEAFRRAGIGTWIQTNESESSQTFVRKHPLPDSAIGWMSPSLTIAPINRSALSQQYQLSNAADKSGHVIFAQPWYPGYSATLDGRPLKLTAYRDMLPEVEIPPELNGVLKIAYWPAGLTVALIGAACSGLILLGIALVSQFSGSWRVVSPRSA